MKEDERGEKVKQRPRQFKFSATKRPVTSRDPRIMVSGKGKDDRGAVRPAKPAGQRSENSDPGHPNSVVIPLSHDKSQRSLFSLNKVVRLGRAQTAVSFTAGDLESCRSRLEDARTAKFDLLGVLRRLACYRLCMEDLRVSKLGGIVRVLSLVHPKDEVREAAERLLSRWKRQVLREVFPLPRSTEMAREASGSGSGSGSGGFEGSSMVGQQREGQQREGQQTEDAGQLEEVEETYGYDVETAKDAPEGTEVAPEELIRMEEEDAAYERMLERMARVEADPLCSSSSDDEEAYSESDMWSPGMDRKRRTKERAMKLKRAKQGSEAADGDRGALEDGGPGVAGAPAPRAEKPRLSRAFVNLFAGGKKKIEAEEPGQVVDVVDKTQDGSGAGENEAVSLL